MEKTTFPAESDQTDPTVVVPLFKSSRLVVLLSQTDKYKGLKLAKKYYFPIPDPDGINSLIKKFFAKLLCKVVGDGPFNNFTERFVE